MLRPFRILIKLALIIYHLVVNLIFVYVVYFAILVMIELFYPTTLNTINRYLLAYMPVIIVGTYFLYLISPLHYNSICKTFGITGFNDITYNRILRLVNELEFDRDITYYQFIDDDVNAITFGKNSIAISSGALRMMSDEEFKGVICHEYGHIVHRDYYFSLIIFSLTSMGRFFIHIPIKLFTVFSRLVSVTIGAVIKPIGSLMNLIHDIIQFIIEICLAIIYGVPEIIELNLNKYAEYRCDKFALKYGCAEGLYLFLSREELVKADDSFDSFFAYLTNTHPKTKKRMKRLSKLMKKNKIVYTR